MGLPLPLFGNTLEFRKYFSTSEFDASPLQNYFMRTFTKVPSLFFFQTTSEGAIFVSSPEIAQDIYVKYNKFFDKGGRVKDQTIDLFGNSVLLMNSDEKWATKRKHLSSAFYKDKMIKMLHKIIYLTQSRVEEWKKEYANKDDKEF